MLLDRFPMLHQSTFRGAVGKLTAAKCFCILDGSTQRRVWKRSSKAGVPQHMAKARNWRLVIVGSGHERHEAQVKRLIANSGQGERIDFFPPMFNELRDVAFNASDAFVLPSLSEGLPMALLEAWARGLPVVMTTGMQLARGLCGGSSDSCRSEPGEYRGWP